MKNESDSRIDSNDVLIELRRLKKEVEASSWLLGEELKNRVVKELEEKETNILEYLVWLAKAFNYKKGGKSWLGQNKQLEQTGA
jgi:hypothetical protein